MFTTTSLLIFFFLSFKFLSDYIKTIRTGDPNESDLTYWMFSYDFKSKNKDWVFLLIEDSYSLIFIFLKTEF